VIEFGVTRRYTEALFQVAEADKAIGAVQKDFDQLAFHFKDEPDVMRILTNPTLGRDARKDCLRSCFEKGISALTLRFMEILVVRGRMDHFEDIRKDFAVRVREAKGETEVNVTTAYPLADKLRDRLKAVMEKKLNKKIHLNCDVNKNLLAGLVIEFGHRVIDASARTQLNEFKNRLLTAEG